MWVSRENVNLEKAMIIRLMRLAETAGVITNGPKGRRSEAMKRIAGDNACGTFSNVLREIELFCRRP